MLSYFSLYLSLNLVNLYLATPTRMSGRFELEQVAGLTGMRT